MKNLNKELLKTIEESLERFLSSSPTSNEKLKPLHGNIKRDLLCEISSLKNEQIKNVELISLDYYNSSEDIIKGRYYNKAVDISIKKEHNPIGAIGVKFVMNNYKQNANNYFENMLGETANIRSAGIPYFQILILFEQMPYFKEKGIFSKWEMLSEKTHLKKYIKLSEDNINEYYHTPILTLFVIIKLPKEITESEIHNKNELNEKLKNLIKSKKLKLSYSSKFSPNIFKDNVILNDYDNFLKRIINFFQYKGIL